MKHLIIGQGNLGKDLLIKLREQGESVIVFERGDRLAELAKMNPDVVWCSAGSGGPNTTIEGFYKHVETNILLTAEILCRFPAALKVFFSTHYLNNDPQGKCSQYALTKRVLEDLCAFDKNPFLIQIFRVGSLYGRHFPEKTFPAKVIRKLAQDRHFELPLNRVTPTPTEWLAEKAITHMLSPGELKLVKNISPSGYTAVCDWGNHIAKDMSLSIAAPLVEGYDSRYPSDARGIPDSEQEPWYSLWERYGWPIFRPLYRR